MAQTVDTVVVSCRLLRADRHLIEAAALRRGAFVGEWLRDVALSAARREVVELNDRDDSTEQ